MPPMQRPTWATKGNLTGLLKPSGLWRMRFDKATPPSAHFPASSSTLDNTNATAVASVTYRRLPASMYPKEVPATFTPFPLPKHDGTLGFGPVRLHNVPDIAEAEARVASAAASESRLAPNPAFASPRKMHSTVATALMEETEDAASLLWDDLNETETAHLTEGTGDKPLPTEARSSNSLSFPPTNEAAVVGAEDLGGYHTHPLFPLMDVLECERSVEDLLQQFYNRPQWEARAATVLDFASTLQRRSNEELTRVLYELSSLFTFDGNGLQFIVTTVVKFGRGYTVTSELTRAFMQLVDAMSIVFMEEQPQRLAESPALLVQVLHFLALIKIMEPNKWYSLTANAMQNRADYVHPRGVNNRTGYVQTGRALVDYLEDFVSSGFDIAVGSEAQLPQPGDGTPRLTAHWTPEEILDVLAGFSGLMPDGKAPSAVVGALLDELWRRWSANDFVLTSLAQATQLEQLYMVLQVMDVQRDAVLDALLGGRLRADEVSAKTLLEREDTPPLSLTAELAEVRGPDFFSAVSRDKRPAVKRAALEMLTRSLATARAAREEPLLQALIESGMELLLSLPDKTEAQAFAQREGFDTAMLRAIPHMAPLAARVHAQEPLCAVYPLTTTVKGGLPDTGAVLAHLHAHPMPYLCSFEGRRVHPVRTFVSSLDYIRSMDNVFLLHSSGVSTQVHSLISVVRRLRGGKDALIVTASCLRALQAASQYGRNETARQRADRALEILSGELEAGRAILLAVSEELYLHDAGAYCDEDLMLWTLAAYFARDLPLVKVHSVMSKVSAARNPHHMLQGAFTPMTKSSDLYNASTPLLHALRSKEVRSLTHHPMLQRPVADRPHALYKVKPNRAHFVYRRDKAMFDKYHVTARNLAPGFSQGALDHDLRGLGFYTPDHPQVPYTPVSELKTRPVPSRPQASLP